MPPFFSTFVTRVPVEDHHGRLYALGVPLWLDPPCRVSDDYYWKMDDALNAKAAAEGANAPVALTPRVWLKRCARCHAPFIGLPSTKLRGDECRAAAKRDSVRRASAKRSIRRSEVTQTRFCRHCGREAPATRATKRFCSAACRVAAHRGSPSPAISALDRQIADYQGTLARWTKARAPSRFRHAAMKRIVEMQAKRAKLKAEH